MCLVKLASTTVRLNSITSTVKVVPVGRAVQSPYGEDTIKL